MESVNPSADVLFYLPWLNKSTCQSQVQHSGQTEGPELGTGDTGLFFFFPRGLACVWP